MLYLKYKWGFLVFGSVVQEGVIQKLYMYITKVIQTAFLPRKSTVFKLKWPQLLVISTH